MLHDMQIVSKPVMQRHVLVATRSWHSIHIADRLSFTFKMPKQLNPFPSVSYLDNKISTVKVEILPRSVMKI